MKYTATPSRFFVALVMVALLLAATACFGNPNPKQNANGTAVQFYDLVVTYNDGYNDCYVSDQSRLFGIRVCPASSMPARGTVVSYLYGWIQTTTRGERYINASVVNASTSTADIAPIRCAGEAVGGGNWNYNSQTGAGQQGYMGRAGLNNIGTVATVSGHFVSASGDWLLIDDTGYDEFNLDKTLYCYMGTCPGWSTIRDQLGALVDSCRVTGVISVTSIAGTIRPILLCRDLQDLDYATESVITAPTGTFVTGGWSLFSLPRPATDPNPWDVLNTNGGYLEENLTGWNPHTQTQTVFDTYYEYGYFYCRWDTGYWLHVDGFTAPTMSYEGDPNDRDSWVPLGAEGTAIIGCPFDSSVEWEDVLVTDGLQIKTMTQARDAGWLDSILYGWDPANGGSMTQVGLPDDWVDDTSIDPWKGYWCTTNTDGLALIMPVP